MASSFLPLQNAIHCFSSLIRDHPHGANIDFEYLAEILRILGRDGLNTDPEPVLSQNEALRSLPVLCCEAVGGHSSQAERVNSAWLLFYKAAHLLDLVEDSEAEDRELLPAQPAQILNAATGLIFAANMLLNLEEGDMGKAIREDFSFTGWQMCAGQHADLTQAAPGLQQCWQIAEAKSGEFFALACRAGARLGGAAPPQIEAFDGYGRHLGILIQIADDVSGLWSATGERCDLIRKGKWTLPVAYAMTACPDEKQRELQQALQQAAKDTEAERQARRLIIESGAVLYLRIEAEKHSQQCLAALDRIDLPSAIRERLSGMVTEIASLGQS